MKNRSKPRYWWIATLSACLLLATTGRTGAAIGKGVQPREVTLDNGLKLLLVERHEQPSVSAGIFYKVGSVNDPRGKSGIAHLFEHMLFKGSRVIGTTDFAAEKKLIEQQDKLRSRMIAEMNRMRLMKRRGEIEDVLDPGQWTAQYTALKKEYHELLEAQRQYMKNNELDSLYTNNGGAMLNAGTGDDMTVYFVQLPANKLELFFWLDSDRMFNGVMREFYVERDNVREERRLRVEATPTGKFDEAFEALFWQSHPYGVPIVGWPSEVESITRDDVREFYRVHYAPNNATLVLVGDFDSDEAIGLAKRYFGRIPRGETAPPPVITEEPRPIAERRLSAEADTNPRVRVRYHTVAIGHKDEAALEVFGNLLSGKTGRLYKRLVTKEEAALGRPGAGNESSKYAGFFEVDVTVKEDRDPEEVERLVLAEIDKLSEGEITDYELEKVKNQILATSVRRLENNLWLMIQLGVYETWFDWRYINEAPERMLQVTADDVHKVVKKYFDPKTRSVAIYRTKEGATSDEDPELAALLASMPTEQHQYVKGMINRIKQVDDLGKLAPEAQMMEQAMSSGQIPEEQKAVFEYLLKVVRARVAELETANKEAQ